MVSGSAESSSCFLSTTEFCVGEDIEYGGLRLADLVASQRIHPPVAQLAVRYSRIHYYTYHYIYTSTVTSVNTMPEHDTDALVTGKYLIAFVQSTGEVSPVFERKTRSLFEEQLGELDPEEWYQLGTVAELYESIRDDVGQATMRKGGVATGEALPFDTANDLEGALASLNEEHKAAFRDSDMEWPAGKYFVKDRGSQSVRVGVDEAYPYPESFVEGVFDAFVQRYGPPDTSPTLEAEEPDPGERFVWKASW